MRSGQQEERVRWLDVPVSAMLPINVEALLYALLIAIAAIACLSDLGSRTLSHDECVHAIYSRDLYAGRGFQHEPWRHGPFLYHINALVYALLGVSDATARVSTALFGVSTMPAPSVS